MILALARWLAAPETAADGGTLDEFVFGARDLWPLALLVPLAAGAFAWGAHRRSRALRALGNPLLVERLVATVHRGNRLLAALATCLAVACVVLGLMRPQYGGTAKIVPASGLDLVLVVDYSKSMLAQDVYPSRSERLEAELARFLDDADRRGDRVGLVVFAGRPRGFPITRDSRMLKLYLERADPRSENPGGTAIGKALDMALAFLVDARRATDAPDAPSPLQDADAAIPPAESDQAIILLTDGEDTESKPLEVAERAAELGVKIYTVGIGSKSGEPVQRFDEQGKPDGFVTDADGNYVMTRLDDTLLREIAQKTDGRFVRVDPKTFGLDEVRSVLESLSRSRREDKIEIHREEGFTFAVVPGLVLLSLALALPRRRRKT